MKQRTGHGVRPCMGRHSSTLCEAVARRDARSQCSLVYPSIMQLQQSFAAGNVGGRFAHTRFSAITPAVNTQQHASQQASAVTINRRELTVTIAAGVLAAPWLQRASAHASEPAATSSATQRIQRDYDTYAASYDELDDGALSELLGFRELRAELLAKASGSVLEVAVGTGLNLQFYNYDKVQRLTAIDLSNGMLQQAQARASQQLPGRPIEFLQADATQLPLEGGSYDFVVDTFSLCVIPDPAAALAEMARVVSPSGRVLLLEHVRSDNPLLATYQDVSASAVAASSKGCVWNQDVPALMRQVGLHPVSVTRYTGGTIAMIEAVRAV